MVIKISKIESIRGAYGEKNKKRLTKHEMLRKSYATD
ncbi:hypothetical protein IGK28_002611 [Enterococcus sp. DIV0182]